MAKEQLYFQTKKIGRGSYFVEYSPPITSIPFGTVQLVFPEVGPKEDVAAAMERELAYWAHRYSVPAMVSSFDGVGDLIDLDKIRPCNFLIGWKEPTSDRVIQHWRLLKSDEIPKCQVDAESLAAIFSDIPYRTSSEVRVSATKHQRSMRAGWWLVFLWVAAIPLILAIFEFGGPEWVAGVSLFYAVSRIYVRAIKMFGKWPRSKREIEKEEEDLRMRHHHYHCELNPDGFLRLKIENIERENRDKTRHEALELAQPIASGHRISKR